MKFSLLLYRSDSPARVCQFIRKVLAVGVVNQISHTYQLIIGHLHRLGCICRKDRRLIHRCTERNAGDGRAVHPRVLGYDGHRIAGILVHIQKCVGHLVACLLSVHRDTHKARSFRKIVRVRFVQCPDPPHYQEGVRMLVILVCRHRPCKFHLSGSIAVLKVSHTLRSIALVRRYSLVGIHDSRAQKSLIARIISIYIIGSSRQIQFQFVRRESRTSVFGNGKRGYARDVRTSHRSSLHITVLVIRQGAVNRALIIIAAVLPVCSARCRNIYPFRIVRIIGLSVIRCY